MPIAVEIVSKERKLFEELEATMVIIPASEGLMGVLPNHAPVLTTLGFGELIVKKGEAEERFAIYGGVVDIRPTKVTILAEMAESSFDLDMEAIEKARTDAAEMVAKGVSGLSEAHNFAVTQALRRAELAAKIDSKMRARTGGLRIIQQDAREAK
ncbi:MAG: ATP synthase F1 subunit epsilon [Anaerolineae bacterium]|jgi:F-type H+-transporting ATPase subunit epsilon|nr:ATP synthase F1 subunit epsilon [Anaerolineae bacterium]